MLAAMNAGLCRVRVEDHEHDGGHVVVRGQRLVNMGSCAYLGLNVDPRLKKAATAAIDRFGPVFSSSTAYTSIDLYARLEEQLREIMGCRVIVPTTTTLGHLAFFQVAPADGDVLVVDAQSHASIHMALNTPRSEGVEIVPVLHNDEQALRDAVEAAERNGARRVWYVADGVYSMYGDVFPAGLVRDLLDRHPTLHVYIDDAHGLGWHGASGRGVVLEAIGGHPRVVVAASLSKSFGSGGAAIAIPDDTLADTIQMSGGPMMFSGPLHPAELGAAVASADIHLSRELDDRQAELDRQISLMAGLLESAALRTVAKDHTPIWFVPVGTAQRAIGLGSRLLEAGFFANVSTFPAVPPGLSGVRFTQTLYHSDSDLQNFVEAMAESVAAIEAAGDVIDLRE